MVHHEAPHHRIDDVVTQAVLIVTPQNRESRVKTLRSSCYGEYREVGWQDPVEPSKGNGGNRGPCILRYIDVHDLCSRVHTGIGSTRTHHTNRRHSEHRGDGLLQFALDAALVGLTRPAAEVGAVIGTVESQSHRSLTSLTWHARSSLPITLHIALVALAITAMRPPTHSRGAHGMGASGVLALGCFLDDLVGRLLRVGSLGLYGLRYVSTLGLSLLDNVGIEFLSHRV